jgi:hypothetical protein
MANDFEKAIESARYSALPLPREMTGPTTIFEWSDGHLIIVRNPHSACLPDPPLAVTEDTSVDLLTFERQFSFDIKGFFGFLAKIFGAGQAKSSFEVKSIQKATVQMGGLAHHTVETGALMEYLLPKDPSTFCMREILDKDHFTIVAALRAKTFTYEFTNDSGATVQFTSPEAVSLFQANASVDVKVASDGKIVVTSPTYVGYVAWDGKRIAKELQKAKAPARMGLVGGAKPVTSIAPFMKASPSTINLIEKALPPDELRQRRLASMGIRRVA